MSEISIHTGAIGACNKINVLWFDENMVHRITTIEANIGDWDKPRTLIVKINGDEIATIPKKQTKPETGLHSIRELSAAMKEIERLKDALRAAWRIRYYGYYEWSKASGQDNCPHGICKGIECVRCDELKLLEMYNSIYNH